jgi:hypothetical protein
VPASPTREGTAQTLPETAEQPDPFGTSATDRKGRHGAVVAGVLAAVVAGAGVGIGGFLVLSRAGDDTKKDKPSLVASSTVPQTTGSSSSAAVPLQVKRAATPRDLRTVDKGQIVVLRWKLAKNNDYPIWVQQSDGSGTQTAPQALPPHSTTVTLSGLDARKGYCFTVGALVALGQSNGQAATIAWSKPKCIRGATAQ